MLIDVVNTRAVCDEGRRNGGREEGVGVEVAGAEEDGVERVLDVVVCEADGAREAIVVRIGG